MSWIDDLIHTTITGDCMECDKKPNFIRLGEIDLYNKYTCKCIPSLCKECLKKHNRCPQCKKNAYYKLNKDQIKSILISNFDEKNFLKIISKIVTDYNVYGVFSIDNLVASSSDITDALNEVYKTKTITYDHLNNIYTLAYDIWNIPDYVAGQTNTAYCYKNTMNNPPKTYKSFIEFRYGCTTMKKQNYEFN